MRLLKGGACYAYGANSFIKVTPATGDRVGSQSLLSAWNAVKYDNYVQQKSRLSKVHSNQLRCVHSLLQRTCSTYVSITYLMQQRNVLHLNAPQVKINLTLLQYRNAVVGAETAFRTLQPQRS